jgi:sn-glycerol 3-phosphate transport system permease protein
MEKRVTFRGWWLPALLIAPQVLISAVFFFYPAGQAIWQSLFIPDPFGLSSQFVGLGNFEYLLGDRFYRASFLTTAIFSILVTLCSMIPALFLAVIADRLIKGSGVYRTMLIWPYAVAPAIAGVLWLFMFNTRVGVVSWYLGNLGYDWNHVLNGGEAMGLVVVASAWGRISYNFLFFFAALQAVPRSVIEAAAIDGACFWKRSGPSCCLCCRQPPSSCWSLTWSIPSLKPLVLSTRSLREGRSNLRRFWYIKFSRTVSWAKT